MKHLALGVVLLLSGCTGCSSGSGRAERLKSALERTELSLAAAVTRAAAGRATGFSPFRAALLPGSDPVFSVAAVVEASWAVTRLDRTGKVIATETRAPGVAPCPTALSVTDAIARAEQAAGGR